MSDVDQMIEDAARAEYGVCIGLDGPFDGVWHPNVRQDYREAAVAALESLGLPLSVLAALKAGAWQAVPKEPTGDKPPITLKGNMQRHGAAAMWDVTERQVAGLDMAATIYRAMLAAAPATPESQS